MNDNIERICYDNKLLSIIIRNNYVADDITFITPDDMPHQLGYMNREKDYIIPPHIHNRVPRTIEFTQETIVIRNGIVRVDFYNDNQEYLESRMLYKGDIILLANGGHGFKMIQSSEMIEIKQGPYCGSMDKVRFEPVDDSLIIIK